MTRDVTKLYLISDKTLPGVDQEKRIRRERDLKKKWFYIDVLNKRGRLLEMIFKVVVFRVDTEYMR